MKNRCIGVALLCALLAFPLVAAEGASRALLWMPWGDSITEGERDMGHPDRGDANSRGGYRFQLWRRLADGGRTVRSVGFRTGHQGTEEAEVNPAWAWHCGLYGGLIRPVAGRKYGAHLFNVESALEHAGHPDVITLMLGINDLSFLPSDDPAGIRDVFDAWVALACRLADLRPHSQVLVSTLLPVVPGNASDGRFGPFNDLVRAAAKAGTAPFDRPNVRLADVCRLAFGDAYDANFFKPDGVHPNEAGSIRVAEAWLPAFEEAIAALEAAHPAIVHLHNGVPGQVRVRLNRFAADFAGATLRLDGGATLTDGTPDPDDAHVLVFPCATPFRNGAVASATLTHGQTRLEAASAAIELLGSGAAENVPADFREGFVRIGATALGSEDASAADVPAGPIRRVAYYLELKRPGLPPQFVWVSMDAGPFGNDPARIGLPDLGAAPIKAEVGNLAVFGNRGNFAKTVTGGRGIVEITPLGYTGADAASFPAEATPGAYGWNDTFNTAGAGYGCLQVARIREGAAGTSADPAAEMILAYNGFRSGIDDDAGIGSFVTHRDNLGTQIDAVHDWTFFARLTGYAAYAPAAYEHRLLEVWVEPGGPLAAPASGPWVAWGDRAFSAETASPPHVALAFDGTDASVWRLEHGDGHVEEDGSLRTGTGAAPTIRFGKTIDVGYDSADAMTVVAVVRGVPDTPLGKPLIHVGNGTTGVGCALETATTLTGTWGNGVWGSCNVFPPAGALAGTGSVCVALTTGTRPARMTVFPCADGVPAWTSVTDLQGTGLQADRIVFGNFVNADTDGLDFTLERVAVFRGVPSDGALRAFAQGGTLTLPAGARCTRLESSAPPLAVDATSVALLPEGTYAALALPEGVPDPAVRLEEILARSDLPGAIAESECDGGALLLAVRRDPDNLIILPMGDSLTHGSSNGANWRKPFFDAFAAAGRNVRSAGFWEDLYSVGLAAANAPTLPACRRHNGISGQRISTAGNRAGYLQGIDNFLDAAGHPDVITLLIGTNDAGEEPGVAFDRWLTLVRRLIAKRPDAWVLVATIPATRGQTAADYAADPFRPAYNDAIAALFDREERLLAVAGQEVPCVLGTLNASGRAAFGDGARIRFVDLRAALGFAGEGGANPLFLDDLHPNQAGHDRWAAVWAAAVEALPLEGRTLTVRDAFAPEGDLSRVSVVLGRNIRLADASLAVDGVPATRLTLSEDGRTLTGLLPTSLAPGGEATLAVTAVPAGDDVAQTVTRTFVPVGRGAAGNVAEADGYVRVRWAPQGLPRAVASRDEAQAALVGVEVPPHDRVAWYFALARPGGPVRHVWVSADAEALPEGILDLPAVASQMSLADARICSNALPEGSADCFAAFCPGSAGSANGTSALPAGLPGWYDWNDTLNVSGAYGLLQLWRCTPTEPLPAEPLFTYGRWTSDSGADEFLIGPLATHSSGRTPSLNGVFLDDFAPAFAAGAYAVRDFELWVRPTEPDAPGYRFSFR